MSCADQRVHAAKIKELLFARARAPTVYTHTLSVSARRERERERNISILAREQIVSGTAAASALKLQLHAERFVLSTTAAPHLSFISCITPTEMQPSLRREYK